MFDINPTDIANDLRKTPFLRVTYGKSYGPSIFDHDYATLIATEQMNELRLQVFLALFNKLLENSKNETTSKNNADTVSE